MLLSCLVARAFPLALVTVAASIVFAQDFPSKPIRIVTSSAGGGNDFAARLVAQGITGPLGQPVIVDNRGSGILSAEVGSKAPPDGYNLVVIGSSLWVLPLLRKVTYDVTKDFTPVSLLVREVNILAVHPSVPVRSVKELIALAKARPGELNYSASSVGASSHLGPELIKSMAGINIVHVPYKGTTPAVTALISGEVQLTVADGNWLAPHVKLGKLKALAVTSSEPSPLFPGLPTVAASGLPGFEATGMTGILAPAKTPEAIVQRLSLEIVRVLKLPDVRDRFSKSGVDVVGNTPEEFAAVIKSDTARWAKVIKDAGIKLD